MSLAPDAPEIIVVGAGPSGLFAVYQLGIMGMRCRVIEAMDCVGGQCAAYYADKPVYDVPGFPQILAGELIERLLKQIEPFSPAFECGHLVTRCGLDEDNVSLTMGDATVRTAPAVVLATGIGSLSDLLPGVVQVDGSDEDGPLISVPSDTFSVGPSRIFAIGDAVTYPGKLRLMVSGFHEAALMAQAVKVLVQVKSQPRRKKRRV